MSYHKLPNLGRILQGDLLGDISKGIGSKDFLNHECNYNSITKFKVACAYGDECRACCIVYRVTLQKCLPVYVGNNQKTTKK